MPALSMELLLFGGRALILLLGFVTLIVCFRRWHNAGHLQARETAERLDVVIAELRALREVCDDARGGLHALGEQVQTQLRLARAAGAPGAAGYEVAIRLARNGASTEELVASSGVSRQEAQLLARMHGPDTTRQKMSA